MPPLMYDQLRTLMIQALADKVNSYRRGTVDVPITADNVMTYYPVRHIAIAILSDPSNHQTREGGFVCDKLLQELTDAR